MRSPTHFAQPNSTDGSSDASEYPSSPLTHEAAPADSKKKPFELRAVGARPSRKWFLMSWPLALVLFSCDASSPTAPRAVVGESLVTPWGTATVVRGGNPFDADKALERIIRGYTRAAEQRSDADTVRMTGVTIEVVSSLPGRYGEFDYPSTLRMLVGVEDVLNHEVQHYLCYSLYGDNADTADCCYKQDHRPGYDLNCQAQ